MISMARIQSPAMGFPGLQRPILPTMGQNGTGVMPPGAPSPHVSPTPDFLVPPIYNFPVLQEPAPVVVTPAPAAMPTWAIVGLAAAAGAALIYLLRSN